MGPLAVPTLSASSMPALAKIEALTCIKLVSTRVLRNNQLYAAALCGPC